MNLKDYDIKQYSGIANWDQALPLGNGKIGMLLYGTDNIRISLDRVDLWDTRVAPLTNEEGFNYKNLEHLVKSENESDWQEFLRMFNDYNRKSAYPSKITAGRIELNFKDEFVPDFLLSIENAIAYVIDENNKIRISGFASATEYIGVMRVYGDYSLDLHIPDYISKDSKLNDSPCMDYPLAEIISENGFYYYRQKTHTDFEYGIVVLQKTFREYSELYFAITTNNDSSNDLEDTKKQLIKCAGKGYEALFEEHTLWWNEYWSKSQIDIGDPMIESVYYRSWYLFASCSREGFYPMPLQGVWTADNDRLPPWKGDYHHDTNTQLSYQSYLKANHLLEGKVFLDYLWSLREAFSTYAHDFFGVDGILIPGASTIDGKLMGGWPQYTEAPTMAIWTAQSFDEYYLYTGDIEFLKTRAYPFFEEIGKAIEGILVEQDGKLFLPLSTSPEIHDNCKEAYLTPNSNFDLSLLRYLFDTLVKYSKILGKVESNRHWKALFEKLDDIALDGDKILLAKDEALNESHRHLSHLMCLYPLHQINYDSQKNKAIYDCTLKELERLGTFEWVGFSFGTAAQIYAMALNGNGAYKNLYKFADGFVEENGFHLNGDFKNRGYSNYHYRPFTLEASFGFCDALHEMLLQDHMGYIRLFPAIPDKWSDRKISFTNLRSRNGVLVSAIRDTNGLAEISLNSEKDIILNVYNSFLSNAIIISSNSQKQIVKNEDGIIKVKIEAGKTLRITRYEQIH
ncbi:MAG: glycoside hydrolase N-terminal domain-containing protein [Lachnospiraceae bacterium]|nr:glycoside hydrolase N-terminal domain-containing protein [Lachnospiraceae bacterium]